jgi:hypothetical protein
VKLFLDRRPLEDFEELIQSYPTGEFASPCRSTVALLSLVKHGEQIWKDIADLPGLDGGPQEAHFEYTVSPPAGSGKASHTDIMLIGGESACSVEAKWTEPKYETVSEWRVQGGDNRDAVLGGWLSLLQRHATRPLDPTMFSTAVYQTVHRAASACAAGRRPSMTYIQFSPLPCPFGKPA